MRALTRCATVALTSVLLCHGSKPQRMFDANGKLRSLGHEARRWNSLGLAKRNQKFIARNRAPRVQVEYDVELYGAEKTIQLPFVMGVLIYIVNPGYIMDLFIDPRGHFLIGLGLTSFAIGAFVMYKMVKFDV